MPWAVPLLLTWLMLGMSLSMFVQAPDSVLSDSQMPMEVGLDEPTSALDPIATAKIEELISTLKSKLTIVIVTHSMSQASRISDHTAFLYLGDLIEFGETKQIFEDPKQELTGQYISGRFG